MTRGGERLAARERRAYAARLKTEGLSVRQIAEKIGGKFQSAYRVLRRAVETGQLDARYLSTSCRVIRRLRYEAALAAETPSDRADRIARIRDQLLPRPMRNAREPRAPEYDKARAACFSRAPRRQPSYALVKFDRQLARDRDRTEERRRARFLDTRPAWVPDPDKDHCMWQPYEAHEALQLIVAALEQNTSVTKALGSIRRTPESIPALIEHHDTDLTERGISSRPHSAARGDLLARGRRVARFTKDEVSAFSQGFISTAGVGTFAELALAFGIEPSDIRIFLEKRDEDLEASKTVVPLRREIQLHRAAPRTRDFEPLSGLVSKVLPRLQIAIPTFPESTPADEDWDGYALLRAKG